MYQALHPIHTRSMYQATFSLVIALLLSISAITRAQEPNTETDSVLSEVAMLQGYGAFSHLNKDWMLMALYTLPAPVIQNNTSELTTELSPRSTIVQRLEIKIAAEKFTERRFRSLWLETLAIEHGADKVAEIEHDLEDFFNMLKGPLIKGDTLIIERTATGASVRINYHKLARVSDAFLPLLVQSLVGKHPPTQSLKTSLLGEDSTRDQMILSFRFDDLEPTLPRIAEVSRWGKGDFAH